MRITGGVWASRRIAGAPRNAGVRPTPDALREQAFAILGPVLEGASFLDLFAGTGVVSLEALSRGAYKAWLVERAAAPLRIMRHNFEVLAVEAAHFRLLSTTASRAIAILAREGARCSVAWCDPPFAAWAHGLEALASARRHGVLPPGATVVLETPGKKSVAEPGFETVRMLRGAVLLAVH
jgi:16S rRNA (guanine966-N2)-methyltransferase